MTIRELMVKFGFEVDRKSEKQAEGSIRGIRNLATKLLGAIGIAFTVTGLSNLAQAAGDADALRSQFTQVFGDMESDAASRLQAIADDTGVFVNRMKSSFTQIAAFSKTTGLEEAEALEIADRAMQAVTDSAAFYDRSIEDVTESMRSFLKCNFEQDAALGLSATETTRNAAANELYGKSFKDLSEAEKQFTLLKMVEDANKASGALGQAARESDTWTNQLGNLKQALTDMKAAVGATFLKPAVVVLKVLVNLIQRVTHAIEGLMEENGLLTRATERYHALVKRLQPAIERMVQTFSNGLNIGIEIVKKVTDRLGGVGNVLKILAVIAGAFLIAMNWGKIISGAQTFMKFVSGIGKLFSVATLKILAIVAVVVILALIIEDFINFMMGNDSVIGTVFEKAGIDADNARAAILNAWNTVKEFLLTAWQAIKNAAQQIFGSLSAWWSENGESVMDAFSRIWEGIKNLCVTLWDALSSMATTIFGALQSFWETWGDTIMEVFSILWNTLISLIGPFLDAMAAIIDFLANVFTGNWEGALQSIKDFAASIWEMITGIFTGAWDIICSVWDKLAEIFSGIFQSARDAVTEKVTGIKDSIVNGFQEAIDWIKSLPEQAVQWGADFIGGLIDGIMSGIDGIVEAVGGIADKIRSFLHFSVPDEGPLTDYESWMPDFIGGLARGISENESVVLDKVESLAGSIQALMSAATANAATAVTGTVNNMTSSVTQNVNIENSYTGGSAETQRNVSKAMKKSAVDATTQMARGLAYARG